MPASLPLRLSVLDQVPIVKGSTSAEALENAVSVARHVDRLGFHRLWYSEHHAIERLACTAPEILIARVGSETKRIRLGSGGIMLPHYSPYKVAEVFRTLLSFYPGRIDLGIGRAPGGGPLESQALRRIRSGPSPDDFPQQLAELLGYLHPEKDLFPRDHPFARLRVMPQPSGAPDLWLLGSSMWSSVMAAANGLPYAFAHFFPYVQGTRAAIEHYQSSFQPSEWRSKPESTIAIGALVAPTQEEAEYHYSSVKLVFRRLRSNDHHPLLPPDEALRELERSETTAPLSPMSWGEAEETEFPRFVVGTPESVHAELTRIARELHLNELIVTTMAYSHEVRLRSYSLLAEAFGLPRELDK